MFFRKKKLVSQVSLGLLRQKCDGKQPPFLVAFFCLLNFNEKVFRGNFLFLLFLSAFCFRMHHPIAHAMQLWRAEKVAFSRKTFKVDSASTVRQSSWKEEEDC
jgi:hypothetical protein